MTKTRMAKVLDIIDQVSEVLDLYGAMLYPMASKNQKMMISASVKELDDMIKELKGNLEETNRR